MNLKKIIAVFVAVFAVFCVVFFGKIGVAEALSKLELPKIVMAGGNTSNGNAAMDAMGLKMVSDLVDKMSN